MTSKELDLCIIEIATGNKKALRQLYDEMKNPIFLFALSMIKDYQAAEDVEQETFLNIMKSARNYQSNTNAKAWIFSIARNCCIDSMKKQSKYISLDDDASMNIPSTNNQFASVENAIIALEALEQLEETERVIVSLYVYAGMKQTEIANVLNLPYLAVRSKYGYAIRKLKRYFEKKGVLGNE